MARDQASVTVTDDDWTELTSGDATNITLQVRAGEAVLRFTTDGTKPTEDDGMIFRQGFGVLNKPLSDLTALSGAARVWAKAVGVYAHIYVDHA